jgi:hypothetical protein
MPTFELRFLQLSRGSSDPCKVGSALGLYGWGTGSSERHDTRGTGLRELVIAFSQQCLLVRQARCRAGHFSTYSLLPAVLHPTGESLIPSNPGTASHHSAYQQRAGSARARRKQRVVR